MAAGYALRTARMQARSGRIWQVFLVAASAQGNKGGAAFHETKLA
jgi:hypothetical protein